MKEVIVIVGPDGQVKIEAVGFVGQSCSKATEALEKALGLPGKRDPKKEFYQQEVGKQQVGK